MEETLPTGEISRLLAQWRNGDQEAVGRLFPLIYDELRVLARRQIRRGRRHATLSTTALVHEAYAKLADQEPLDLNDRHHFFALAAKAMRQILVDYGRSRAAQKRGGDTPNLELDETRLATEQPSVDVLAVEEALKDLERLDPELGQIVELRFFGGLSVEETAEVLKVSPRTIKRGWSRARAFLYDRMTGTGV